MAPHGREEANLRNCQESRQEAATSATAATPAATATGASATATATPVASATVETPATATTAAAAATAPTPATAAATATAPTPAAAATAQRSNDKEASSLKHKLGTTLGLVLCVVLLPVLAINLTLIVRSFTSPSEVPNVGGVFPLIVLTDSMYPDIQSGDLIICRAVDPESVQVGDVIAFFDPAGNGTSIVTHSVADVVQNDGGLAWITRGVANNADDALPVPADKLVGAYQMRLPGVGDAVMFMQTPAGLIVCVACPILLLVGWDVLRRRQYEKRMRAETSLLQSELEELRAQQNSLLGKETM